MFSLRSLVSTGAQPPKAQAATTRDDSGLIDLAALRAQARAEQPKLEVAPFAEVGLFDVPVKAPEPTPPQREQLPARAPRWRTIALLAGAATLVAMAAAIAIGTTRRAGDVLAVAAVHTATSPISPPAEPPKTTAPTPTEVATAATTAPPAPRHAPAPPRRDPRPPGSAGVKPVPPKPQPPCDLMCQMQKSVGKPR